MVLNSKVYKQLRNEIINGQLMPGERLPEIGLGKKFRCSRAPIREALSRLEKEGFVHRRENHGAAVAKSSADEIIDYYSLLEVLESQAVEWASKRLTVEDISHLENLNLSMKDVSTKDESYIEKWLSLNLAFHRYFSEKCGNVKMVWMVEEVRLRITRFRYLSFMLTTFNDYTRDHDEIIEALKLRDGFLAKAAMAKHISRAKEVLLKYFFYMPKA